MQSKSLYEEPAIPRDIEMLKAVCGAPPTGVGGTKNFLLLRE
jgi:hypothetical protein